VIDHIITYRTEPPSHGLRMAYWMFTTDDLSCGAGFDILEAKAAPLQLPRNRLAPNSAISRH